MASVNDRHQEGDVVLLQPVEHFDIEKGPIQQQYLDPNADPGQLVQKKPEYFDLRLVAADRAEGHGKPMASQDHIGRGIGIKVRGPLFGKAMEKIRTRSASFAIEGDFRQVNGHDLLPAAEPFGEVAGQGVVEVLDQLADRSPAVGKGISDSLIGGGLLQQMADLMDGTGRGGRMEQDVPNDLPLAEGTVIGKPYGVLQQVHRLAIDTLAGKGIIFFCTWVPPWLRVPFCNSFTRGTLYFLD